MISSALAKTTLAACLLLSGCLTDPVPLQVDADVDAEDTAAEDTTVAETSDADTTEVDTPVDTADGADTGPGPTPQAFPPPSEVRATRIRNAFVADVDGDGRDDLLLTNVPADSDDAGVYVILGGPDARPDAYDAFIPTRAGAAVAIVADLTAETRPDLVTVETDGSQAFVEIHPQTARASFGTPLVRETTPWPFVPITGSFPLALLPVVATAADLTADGVPDLLLLDRIASWFLAPTAWTSQAVLQGPALQLPSPDAGWDVVVDAFVVSNVAGTTEYLAVLEQFGRITFFPIDPVSGVAQEGIRVTTGVNAMSAVRFDVTSDGRDELVMAAGIELSALTLAPPEASGYGYTGLIGLLPDEGVDALAVLHVDDTGGPEIILLDDEETQSGARSQLLVVRDAYVDSALQSPWSVLTHTFPVGAHPALMAVGRFDDDDAVEVFLYTRDGQSLCRQITTSMTVEVCP